MLPEANASPVNNSPNTAASSASSNNQPTYDYSAYPAQTTSTHDSTTFGSTNHGTVVDDFETTKNHANKLRARAAAFIDTHGGNHLILIVASLALFIQAITDIRDHHGKARRGFGFAIALGFLSMIITAFHHQASQKQLVAANIRLILLIVLAVLWVLGVVFLTFGHAYETTGNGYFATWIGCIIAVIMLSAQTAILSGVWKQFKAFGWQLGLLIICSIVLTVACAADCIDDNSCGGESKFGIAIGVISIVFSLCIFFFVEKVPQTVRMGLFGVICALWVLTAFILTIKAPFTTTGNGYFACWGGALASVLLVTRVLGLGSDNVMSDGGKPNSNVV